MRYKFQMLITLISATFLLGLVQACSFADKDKFPEIPYPLPKLDVHAKNFKSCGEIRDWVAHKSQDWNRLSSAYWEWASRNRIDDTMPVSAVPGHSAPAMPVTNIQVPGVDEPDTVKSSVNEIFFARTDSVTVIDGGDFQLNQTLEFKDETKPRLFYVQDKLIVITGFQGKIRVRSFEQKDRRWKQSQKLELAGDYKDARLIGHSLVLIAQDQLSINSALTDIACADIQRPILDDYNFDLTIFHRIELDKPLNAKTTARVGRADQIYVTQNEVYVFARGYTWFAWDPRLMGDQLNSGSVISRFELKDDAVTFASAGFAAGQVRNQWAFSEDVSGEYLFIATTYTTPEGFINRLWSFKERNQELIVVGASEPFGPREDIRAVRFMGEHAYVVTFEKTDPLFSFDLSQPQSPKLLSHLEIPGFSAYLHPVGQNHLLGIGYATVAADQFSWLGGLQFSLFKTESQGQVSVTEQIEIGGRGSFADVSADHHAFATDAENRYAAIPLRIFAPGDSPWDWSDKPEFSGAYVLEPLKGLDPVAKLSHQEMIPAECSTLTSGGWWDSANDSMDIRRVIWRGGMFISLSPFGAKKHPVLGSRASDRTLNFGDADRECARLRHSPI